jgi:hypothetical protein
LYLEKPQNIISIYLLCKKAMYFQYSFLKLWLSKLKINYRHLGWKFARNIKSQNYYWMWNYLPKLKFLSFLSILLTLKSNQIILNFFFLLVPGMISYLSSKNPSLPALHLPQILPFMSSLNSLFLSGVCTSSLISSLQFFSSCFS